MKTLSRTIPGLEYIGLESTNGMGWWGWYAVLLLILFPCELTRSTDTLILKVVAVVQISDWKCDGYCIKRQPLKIKSLCESESNPVAGARLLYFFMSKEAPT